MSFKQLDYVSPALQRAIDAYIDRIDATQRDRELLYDIVGFAFDEGRIRGTEDTLRGEETKITKHGEEQQKA